MNLCMAKCGDTQWKKKKTHCVQPSCANIAELANCTPKSKSSMTMSAAFITQGQSLLFKKMLFKLRRVSYQFKLLANAKVKKGSTANCPVLAISVTQFNLTGDTVQAAKSQKTQNRQRLTKSSNISIAMNHTKSLAHIYCGYTQNTQSDTQLDRNTYKGLLNHETTSDWIKL